MSEQNTISILEELKKADRAKRSRMAKLLHETEPTGLCGMPLLRWTMNQILKHPEFWEQRTWHCHTGHCFAGWAEIGALGGQSVVPHVLESDRPLQPEEAICTSLGISQYEGDWLFTTDRQLRELYLFCRTKLVNPDAVLIDDCEDPVEMFARILDNDTTEAPYLEL